LTRLTLNQLTDLKLLLSVEGIGPGKIRSLLSKFRTTEKILSADFNSLMEAEGISTNLAKRIQRSSRERDEVREAAVKELDALAKINGYITTVWDPEFPQLLKKIYDPPLLLYCKGKIDESDNYSIGIVGTRMPTAYGKIQAEKIVEELAAQNITIVSGLARGIDSIAHRAALKSRGRTIAVIGSGLNVIYPPENKKLFEEIAESGVVINISCIIIETDISGGAMQTASFALDQNREVFAVPGNLGVKQSNGTNLLIQKGEAALIRNAEDVLVALELKLKPVLGKNIPKPEIDLNLFEEKIIGILNNEPMQIDKIASSTSLTTSDCLVHLLSLEFKGLVKQLPGKMFVAV
jgi:DNA processing protein